MATPKKATLPPTGEVTTYLLNMADGTRQKITVPKHFQMTFGPLVPGAKEPHLNGRQALVLRIWEGCKENQRACISGVLGFRDMTLSVEVEVTTSQEEVVRRHTEDGEKNVVMRGEVREWKNPDSPGPTKIPEVPKQVRQFIQGIDE